MTNAQVKQNESWKNIAFSAIVLIAIISWATPLSTAGQSFVSILIGSILVGLNLVRHQNGIPMSKGSFLIGSFLIASGWVEASPFYFQIGGETATIIPAIIPLIGLLLIANAIYKRLQR